MWMLLPLVLGLFRELLLGMEVQRGLLLRLG